MLDAVKVVRELQRHGSFIVDVGPFTNVWTPQKPRSHSLPVGFQQMPGRGTLEYTLDPDGETVHLRWQPKRGPERAWAGPIPVMATPRFRAASRRSIGIASAIFVGLVVVGGVMGVLGGSVIGGLGAGAVGGYFVATAVWAGRKQGAFDNAYTALLQAEASGQDTPAQGGGVTRSTKPNGAGGDDAAVGRGRRYATSWRTVYAMCTGMVAAGFVIGFSVAGGSSQRRFVAGMIAIVAAMAILAVVTKLARSGLAMRDVVRDARSD